MNRRVWRNFDYSLLLLSLVLVAYGWLMVRSAQPPDRPYAFYQLLWIGVGVSLSLVVSLIDYRLFNHVVRPLYVALLLALGLVLMMGRTAFGGQRWLAVLFFTVQPSELTKVGLIVTLAVFLGRRTVGFRTAAISLLLVIPLAGLIFLQPSLSTALILFAIWGGMLFVAGVPVRYFLGGGVAFVATLPLMWSYLLQEYMRERIRIFLNPLADPGGSGYNLLQSRIAIGAGGLLGQGYGSGGQSQLGYLRVRHTDFIFSVIAEELGFLGALILFVLLMLLIFRLTHVAQQARDAQGRLIVAGVAVMIFFQAVVNIGVNMGLVPPTGVSLPFISYGGSNLITLFIGLGLAQSVALRRHALEFE
ncbi:MAG: rod shape-determining protein RodA [Ardenticatenia bacterium]|nr:rod shape-determining protein RodA [Ardenticatenia bacterium]